MLRSVGRRCGAAGAVSPAAKLAAATALRASIDAARSAREEAEYLALVERLRRALGSREFDTASAIGQVMTADQAIEAALTAEGAPAPTAAQPPGDGALTAKLTRRERQVVELLACGLTNRQIAEQLFNSERTIETHVQKIGSKLGFTRRTQIATWANANGLAATTPARH
ncbi:MAG: LuxR C-terminal-related transcriptional regulator [Thermomicrobiales bacterium]